MDQLKGTSRWFRRPDCLRQVTAGTDRSLTGAWMSAVTDLVNRVMQVSRSAFVVQWLWIGAGRSKSR